MSTALILRLIIQTLITSLGTAFFYILTMLNKDRVPRGLFVKLFIYFNFAFSIAPLVDYNTRVFYSLGIVILSQLVLLKHNILQSFVLTFIFLVMGLILDSVVMLIFTEVLKFEVPTISYGINWISVFASTMINIGIVGITWVLRGKIKAVLIKISYLKNYQITLPLLAIVLMLLYVFWVNFYVIYGNTQSMFVQIIMLVVVFFISMVVFYATDQYMKKTNENLVLKERVSDMSKNQSNQTKSKSEFEKSVEFDLFSSGFGEKISENFQLEGVLYESENSLIYKLTGMDSIGYTLKAISKEKMESVDFKRLQALNINRVASLIEYADTSQFHYFLKPFIDGINLHEHVKANGPMAEKQLVDVLEQLMNIISALHEHTEPLIYRDIKPSNLIIDKAGRLHLIDIETIRKSNAKREMDTILIATKGFTAPEQYGFSQSHEKSDIFSIGATAYFLATGKMPHYDQVHDSNFADHQNVSPKLMAFIRKCMQFNPEDRYASVKEASESLVVGVS